MPSPLSAARRRARRPRSAVSPVGTVIAGVERRLVGRVVVRREPALRADRLVDDEGAVAGRRPAGGLSRPGSSPRSTSSASVITCGWRRCSRRSTVNLLPLRDAVARRDDQLHRLGHVGSALRSGRRLDLVEAWRGSPFTFTRDDVEVLEVEAELGQVLVARAIIVVVALGRRCSPPGRSRASMPVVPARRSRRCRSAGRAGRRARCRTLEGLGGAAAAAAVARRQRPAPAPSDHGPPHRAWRLPRRQRSQTGPRCTESASDLAKPHSSRRLLQGFPLPSVGGSSLPAQSGPLGARARGGHDVGRPAQR